MLTIKRDIYERVLKQIDVRFYMDKNKCIEVNTIPQKWELLVPDKVQQALGMYKDGTLTYIVNGKRSMHHDSTDSNRSKLKESMKGSCSRQYNIMHNHIHQMIWSNAALECYMNTHNESSSKITANKLNEFTVAEMPLIEGMYNEYINRLADKLVELKGEIISDPRMSESMKTHICRVIKKNPVKVLEIIVFLSLFEKDDSDEDFFTEFESHYLKTRTSNSSKSYRNSKNVECINKVKIDSDVIEYLTHLRKSDVRATVGNLAVEYVYSDNRWWAVICLE